MTQNELQTELKISQFGLVKEFILQRDKLINDYKQKQINNTLSTTQSNTHSKLPPNTPSSSTRKLPHCLLNQIEQNSMNELTQKKLKQINDERETSPLLNENILNQQTSIEAINERTNTNTSNTMTYTNNISEVTTNEQLSYDDDDDHDNDYCNDDVDLNLNPLDEDGVITDDDCFCEPLVPPRFSVHTTLTQQSTIDSETSKDGRTKHRWLFADTHGWKNISTNIDDEFVTVHDLKWKRIKRIKSNDSLDVLNIQENQYSKIKVYDFKFLQQFANVSYIDGSLLLIYGFINSNKFNKEIYDLCYKYYFEEEKHVFQFAFDIWKILYKINKCETIDNEKIKSFIGGSMVIEARKKYFNKYRFGNLMNHCGDLLRYNYIQLIARREGTQKILDPDNNFIFMNNNQYLYKFNQNKKRQFKKYHNFFINNLDRNAWTRGTEVEIYSSSLNGWTFGEIIKISGDRQSVVVSYNGETKSKYILKTVKINDIDLIRSTQDFIKKRNEWDINTKIEIYSNSEEMWCPAIIESIIPKDNKNKVIDTFRVKYKRKSDGLYYTKRIDQWSSICRNIPNITNKKLKKYKFAKQCEIWNEDDQQWIKHKIIDIIPKHQYIVVQQAENEQFSNEKFVDFNRGGIRLIKR